MGGEIVSADSRQVYRRLDAATSKPPKDSGVPHHLVDILEPSEPSDAGRFGELARACFQEIRARGKRPILCGGTGLYVRAALDGLSPLPRRDEAVRRRIGSDRAAVHARLAAVDPQAAAAIPPNNIQRAVRALEVYELTGRPISAHWSAGRKNALPRRILSIRWDAEELKTRIEGRARAMWPALLEEVRRLLSDGLTGAEPGFQSLGYPEALACVRGELSSDAGLASMIQKTQSYAKRQRTWFRHQLGPALEIRGGNTESMLAQSLEALA
jgi:tRNA dimethylallyltransferase